MFNATFNNVSVIWWRAVLLVNNSVPFMFTFIFILTTVKKLSLLLTAKPNTYYVDSCPDTQNSICFPVVNPDLSHNKISSQDVCGKFTIKFYFITQ